MYDYIYEILTINVFDFTIKLYNIGKELIDVIFLGKDKAMKKFVAAGIFLVCLFYITSCGSQSTMSNSEYQKKETGPETVSPEDLKSEMIRYTEGRNYGGYTYRILDRSSGWKTEDVYASEMTGEALNDAVYERNSVLCEKLNISIKEIPSEDVSEAVKLSVLSFSDDYDVFTDGLSDIAELIPEEYLFDLRSINSLKLENEWWDQQMYNELSVFGKTFCMTGDISIMDNYGTWCFLFNKKIITDFSLENPYTLVDSGKWTADKLMQMSAQATTDLNGDSKFDANDQYGFITEIYNTYGLWAGFGGKITSITKNNYPEYVYDTEESIEKLMKSVEIQYSPGSSLSVHGVGTETTFSAGQGLFYYAGMINITKFRDCEFDFGILPAPKYNEQQQGYRTTYSYNNLTAYSIPVTSGDPERSGDILECMAALSKVTLTPAYYDITLVGKATRDQESERMIELILNSRNFDLGMIYDWGGLFTAVTELTNSGNVSSKLASYQSAAQLSLNNFIDLMKSPAF